MIADGLTFGLITVVILILFAASGVQAQDPVLDCLIDIPDELREYTDVIGQEIWIDGDYGWLRPPGRPFAFTLYEDDDIMVHILRYWRDKRYEYWFMYSDPVADKDGNTHPCGIFRVKRGTVIEAP
jgi:hypothetical protein